MTDNKHRIIFAIGGGDISTGETLAIDRKIVKAAAKNRSLNRGRAKALFIPTASGDDPEYVETFKKIYGRKLGCSIDSLLLYGKKRSRESIQRQIDWCDLVYVGGGSTPAMLRMWRRYGIDRYLRQAWQDGTIMAGLSAGANCWFRWGLSDAYSGRFAAVSGIALVNYAANVHYSSQRGRKKYFDELVIRKQIAGIALEDNACIKITDNRYKIIRSEPAANAYRVIHKGGKARRLVIPKTGKLHKLKRIHW